jgi:signal transduction histidine kinase
MQLTGDRPAGPADRQHFSLLLDGLPDPAWMLDAGGVLLDFNPAFVAFVRAAEHREARRGTLFHELIAGSEQEELWRDLTTRVRAGRSVAADARFSTAGIERAYTIHGTPSQDAAFFVAREVTVPHSLRDDSLELALMHLFSTEPTLDDALNSALAFLCSSDAWDGAVVWLIEPASANEHPSDEDNVEASGELTARAIWLHESLAHADTLRATMESLRFKYGHGLPGRAWASSDLVWVPDLFDETGLTRADAVAHSGLHTVVAIPLVDSDQTVGVIEVFDRAVRPISTPRTQSLKRAAAAIGRLVERRRADDERRRLIGLVERKGNEWALTFDAIQQPIFLTARDGAIVRLNLAARQLATASSYSDLLGKTIGSLGEGEPWTTLSDLVIAVAESGESCTAHIENDDAVFDVDASPDAEAQRVILTLRDTTEVVRLQESVRRGEQLAALGELVAGVAHQVKNPLFGIGMTVDLLQSQVGKNSETDELFDALRTWLHRLGRLMESLLAYGKTWTLDLRPHSVKDVIEQAIDICRPTAAANEIRLSFFPSADATLLMDPQRLVHAFENLITNALQHSTRNSTVEVTLTTDDADAEIVVADHGPGFREEDLPRIFEPFFTRRRGGTGLGLSIAQRVVDEHGGIIAAQNPKTGGAVVRVRVPRYDERTASTEPTSHSDR